MLCAVGQPVNDGVSATHCSFGLHAVSCRTTVNEGVSAAHCSGVGVAVRRMSCRKHVKEGVSATHCSFS